MHATIRCAALIPLLSAAAALAASPPADTGAPGATTVLKWKDGRQAAFLLAFDDSCESHVNIAIPELKKRGLVGTFYINPGNGPFKSRREAWEKEIPATGMEYGNHTMTHVGALSAEDWDRELAGCSEEIGRCFPDRKTPRLIAYGTPGGIKKENWRLSEEEITQSLARHHLILRPSFYGPPIHLQPTAEAMIKVVDQALAKGEMGHLDFHGVGGDWLTTPREGFVGLLDYLAANRERLWVTDLISFHKYRTERDGAAAEVLESGPDRIRIRLTCTADPALYDLPLTLSTRVPAAWKGCTATQGGRETQATVADGTARYAALPGSDEIVLRPR